MVLHIPTSVSQDVEHCMPRLVRAKHEIELVVKFLPSSHLLRMPMHISSWLNWYETVDGGVTDSGVFMPYPDSTIH